jgi:hypothetical protein
MSFFSIADTSDGSGPVETSETDDLTHDELLSGIASGSEAHLVQWMKNRDSKKEEEAENNA